VLARETTEMMALNLIATGATSILSGQHVVQVLGNRAVHGRLLRTALYIALQAPHRVAVQSVALACAHWAEGELVHCLGGALKDWDVEVNLAPGIPIIMATCLSHHRWACTATPP